MKQLLNSFLINTALAVLATALLHNVEIITIYDVLVFTFLLTLLQRYAAPLLTALLFPINVFVLGQLGFIINVGIFIGLHLILPFAQINSFVFNETNFQGIIIPTFTIDRTYFLIVLVVVWRLIYAVSANKKK